MSANDSLIWDGELLGTEKVKHPLREVVLETPKRIIEHLQKARQAWEYGCDPNDDMTSFVIRLNKIVAV